MGLWPSIMAARGLCSRWAVDGAHKGALALAVLQEAHGHQLLDGLPHRGAAHPQGLGQFPLRHDLLPGLELPPEDQVPDLFIGLVRNPLHLDGLEQRRHVLLRNLKIASRRIFFLTSF